ncbi:MAG: nitrite reductase, copper-containing [Anaerolineae bacterium]|nr:nitrite reductase, copper-containing [Anaerolineae bacterium]RIK16137.1 MAG: nitrite reductase, copper-containing [Anaerolineae bacterium]
MEKKRNIAVIVAGLLGVAGILLSLEALYKVNAAGTELSQFGQIGAQGVEGDDQAVAAGNGLAAAVATSQALAARAEVPINRIGVATIPAAHTTHVPNVAYNPANVPPPINRTEPETVKVTLTTREVTAELADGTTYDYWTFDATVPGPMIRVMEGDTVELTIVNPPESKNGHNIDLHAVNGPGGGAEVTNVMPGESKTFTFTALNPGIYVYHCAYPPPQHHIAQGMYGAILVEPVGGLPPVDREFYVMQGDWYTFGRFGDQGHQGFSSEKALAEQPEYFTFNGHVNALTKIYPLEAKVGETVRVFFGVGGPNVGSNFHIIGEIFDKVYTGAPETFIRNEESWYVPPGSVSTFELHLDVPGRYVLVDHALYRTQKGAAGYLNVTGDWDTNIFSPEVEGFSD